MALSIIKDLVDIWDADNATVPSWTGLSPASYSGFQREGINCLGDKANATTIQGYITQITAANYIGKRVYIWFRCNGTVDTKANGGFRIILGDTTNIRAYYVGGDDDYGFQVGAWSCFMLDCANLPTNYATISGVSTPNLSIIKNIGVGFKTITSSLGNADNCFWDIARFGTGISINSGTTDEISLADIAADDASTTADKAYGIIRELQAGVFGVQGDIWYGDGESGDIDALETDSVVVVEDHIHGSGTPSAFTIGARGYSGGTATIAWGVAVGSGDDELGSNGVTVINSNQDNSLTVDFSNEFVTDVKMYGCKFQGVTKICQFSSDKTNGISHHLSGCTFDQSTMVDTGIVVVRNCVFSDCAVTDSAHTAALLWDDANIDIKQCAFRSSDNPHATYVGHGIKHPVAAIVDYYDLTFLANEKDVWFAPASGDLVITNNGTSNTATYTNDSSGTVTINNNPAVTTITVKDINTQVEIEDARVLLVASSDAGDLPYKESVTEITRVTDTATVDHTAHGMSTGDFALIEDANQEEYNGAHEITVIDVDTYTYTVPGAPTTPATGTITSTGGLFNTLTNASGIVTDSRSILTDQPVVGHVRLSTSPDYYKSSPINESIDTITGLTMTVQLIPDH